VEFSGHGSGIDNTHFGALKVKDAIVDKLRTPTGERPSIDKINPDLRIHLRLDRGEAILSLDLSGHSLHQRGYRLQQGAAPLKENLAAAILIRAGWPRIAAEGGALADPMCGGHLPGRSGDDRRRHGAEPEARALGLHRLARPRAGVVEETA
jgi:23S rRNA (guanine2445-N2)-methyltransferase / 23S rRNA (guanine2069-N7)-methyltransferase